jgi:hypothetical protein
METWKVLKEGDIVQTFRLGRFYSEGYHLNKDLRNGRVRFGDYKGKALRKICLIYSRSEVMKD